MSLKNLLISISLFLFTHSVSASLITTKIEGRFLLGDVFALDGGDITNDNVTASGAASGIGTSSLEFATGICDPLFQPPSGCGGATEIQILGDPNKLSFDNLGLREGSVPTGSFLVGELAFTNNDISWLSYIINSVILEVSAIECDSAGENCDESTRHIGTTELFFAFTGNIPGDFAASADGVCLNTELGAGDTLCSWVPEFATETFSIYGRFGSLIVEDFIPTSSGGFVTVGTDSTQNIKYASVPEPTSLAIFTFGLIALVSRRLKK